MEEAGPALLTVPWYFLWNLRNSWNSSVKLPG